MLNICSFSVTGDNFDPDYVKINPNGTVPSLTSDMLAEPLIDSADILEYLDSLRPEATPLFPKDPEQLRRVEALIAHVHQPQLSTNLILLQARDDAELEAKKASFWNDFIGNRQEKLVRYSSSHPEVPLYASRVASNGALYNVYSAEEGGSEREEFFAETLRGYEIFAAGLDQLDSMLVLPYAAGDRVTAADLHIVPWLAHALWGAGGVEVEDFGPLQTLTRKSVAEFEFGEKTRAWWKNVSASESFRRIYPYLH
jgi:glutathione S-transferase